MSDAVVGLVSCAGSSLLFGSMFVPVKKFDAGDGIFVQWVMSAAILIVGLIVNAFQGFPPFQPLAMLGGVFWAIGNVTAVPILSLIGLGMGILIWGATNCLTGWAIGRFGLFGIHGHDPHSSLLNYLGLVLVIIGGLGVSQLKTNPQQSALGEGEGEEEALLNEDNGDIRQIRDGPENVPGGGEYNKGRLWGIILSLAAGVFYGVNFVPVIYIQDNPQKFPGASSSGLSYVLSHYCGIFITATAVLLVYAVFKQNRPVINARILLPAYITGTMWALAETLWFVGNDKLSQSVTFPINTMLPGVCASLWSVFYFGEIRGRQNFRILAGSVAVTLTGAVLVGISA